ncbi:MAG: M23 family metallopeptidase [Clostridiales bacterium]|nr:M23 family metallopeptidase [Clostridiales bacterium]
MYRRKRVTKRFKKSFGQTLIKQVIVCIIIVLLVIIAKKMDIAIVNAAVETFQTQITKNYTATDIINSGKSALSQVKDGTSTVVATFLHGGKVMEFSVPTDEPAVLSVSAGTDNKTLQFIADKELQVYAAAGGTISEIGNINDETKYIKITHGNNIVTLYGGIKEVYVKSLERVKRGQIIGSVTEGESLFFEIWADGKMIDPKEYIDF